MVVNYLFYGGEVMLGNKYLAAVVGILLILVVAYNIKFFSLKKQTLLKLPAGKQS